MVRALLRVVAATLPALALTIVAPGTAHAAGTYRDDDGTREAAVRLDYPDGDDVVDKYVTLPQYSVPGATGALLWVYAAADTCTQDWQTVLVFVPNRLVAEFNPCTYFPQGSYGWHAFPIRTSDLTDGGTTRIRFTDLDSTGPTASFGVDTSTSGHSTVVQRDASGTQTITGELMVYVELTGSVPSMAVSPASISYGYQPVGTPATRTVTVTSNGTETLHVTGVAASGAAAGDFAVTANGCTGSPLAPGSTCTFDVTFTPSAKGNRTATVTVSGNATARTVAVSGVGLSDPPVSVFTTPDGAILGPLDGVSGTVTDDVGVDREYVTFTPLTPISTEVTLLATTTCDAARTSCTWTASSLRAPGTYLVTAYGIDVSGIVETPGPHITVLIV
jgi:hypothetical protein